MAKCTIKEGKYFAPNGEESLLYKNLRENMSEDEANDLFVLSKTPSFQENVVTPLIEEYRNKVLEIPANIKFKETFANKIRTFHIYYGKLKAGRIQLTAYKDGFKVKSSLVNEDQRGKGIGKYLYNYTISKLLAENNTLYTDTARTEDADRVWESLKRQGLSQDGKSVKPLPREFDKNGEIGISTLLQYTADNFSQLLPLNAVEKSHLINLQIEEVETSDDLYNVLYDAFYKNNLFSPNINKLKKIYSEDEIRNILEDSEIQGRVKETLEKLRQTEEFTIPQIKYNKDFDVRSSKVNIIGQYKKQNPLKLEQQVKELYYIKVPVVNEAGEQLETQLFYENAIKAPSDKSIRALQAIVGAHPMVDTLKLENKLIKTFKNYGMDIEGIERENFKELLDYVTEPTDENRKALEDVLGFVREPLTEPINISPENRSYRYLKTAKSEQELFDEASLIQTNEKNVYHKINKIDEQEIRDIQENQDLTIPVFELYKEYYGYGISSETQKIKEQSIVDGTFMKAPNGKPTNLSEENWLFTRTTAFKSWFGDFENRSETSSKVIDENGEPLVVFHGTKEKFFEFDKSKTKEASFHFGSELSAKERAKYSYDTSTAIIPVFLNIRNLARTGDFFEGKKLVKSRVDYYVERFDNREHLTEENSLIRRFENILEGRSSKLYDFYSELTGLSGVEFDNYLRDTINKLSVVNSQLNFDKSKDKDGLIYKNTEEGIGTDSYIVFSPTQVKSAENTRAQIEQESNDIRYFKKPSTQKEIQTNIQIDSEYLLNDFVADFAAEKLKNPTEFNRQFKITETGIELASNDIITIETVKSYIQDGTKYSKEIADYSLLSKDMPNLKEKDSFTVESVLDKRIRAVNDINSVSKPTTEVTIVDENSFSAPNETNQFLRVGDEIYEQQEQGYYNKLQKNTNPNFFDLNPRAPEFKNFDIMQQESSENKSKKLISKEMNQENFYCF